MADTAIDPEVVRALAGPDVYPPEAGPEGGVRHVQTHISHVFILARWVYKLRKAVSLGFVDFSSREERNADCLREVALNRRLAPDVYLGVAPVRIGSRGVSLGEVGETLAPPDASGVPPEHCVVMVRLPDACDALSMLERGGLESRHLEQLADSIAAFHRAHPFAFSGTGDAWCARIERPVADNFAAIARSKLSADDAAAFALLRERAASFMSRHGARFVARAAAGRLVDGHGDLHLQHFWYLPGDPTPRVIDCVEFRADLREIDAASDVAFLAMDLEYRKRGDFARAMLDRYANVSDDYDLFRVVDYFVSHRAAVRAVVAWLAAVDPEVPAAQRMRAEQSASAHLKLAADALAPRPVGRMIAVSGPVGSGKSTVARAVAEALGGVVIASDRVRKHLFGIGPLDRGQGGLDESMYSSEMTDATYRGLLERAESVVRAGRTAVLDATYATRFQRESLLRGTRALGIDAALVRCACEPAVARSRVAERAARGDDPSDAGVLVFEESARRYEPPDEWPRAVLTVHTDRDDWRERLTRELPKLR
jgi:hypothetical protein